MVDEIGNLVRPHFHHAHDLIADNVKPKYQYSVSVFERVNSPTSVGRPTMHQPVIFSCEVVLIPRCEVMVDRLHRTYPVL
jgi:hypothetical protein